MATTKKKQAPNPDAILAAIETLKEAGVAEYHYRDLYDRLPANMRPAVSLDASVEVVVSVPYGVNLSATHARKIGTALAKAWKPVEVALTNNLTVTVQYHESNGNEVELY